MADDAIIRIQFDDQGAVTTVENLDRGLDQLQEKADQFTGVTRQSTGATALMQNGLQGLAQQLGVTEAQYAAFMGAVETAIPVMLAATVAATGWALVFQGLRAATAYTIEAGDTLYELGEKTDVSTRMLSGLQLAVDTTGASMNELAVGIKNLQRNMVGAGEDAKAAQATFKKLGLDPKEFEDTTDALLDVAEAFKRLPPGAEKTTVAVKLFGRSAQDLIPFLNLGRTGLAEWMEKAEALGIVMDKDVARQADKVSDSVRVMEAAWQSVKLSVGSEILPMLADLVDWTTDNEIAIRSFGNAVHILGEHMRVAIAPLRAFVTVTESAARGWAFLKGLKIPATMELPSNKVPTAEDAYRQMPGSGGSYAFLYNRMQYEGEGGGPFVQGAKALEEAAKHLKEISQGVKAGEGGVFSGPGSLFQSGESRTSHFRMFQIPKPEELGAAAAQIPYTLPEGLNPRAPMPEFESGVFDKQGLAAEGYQKIGDALKYMRGEGFEILQNDMMRNLIPEDSLTQLDVAAAKFLWFQERVASAASLISDSVSLLGSGIRAGGLAMVASMVQVTGMMMQKWGLHMIKQGIMEIALGSAPPPFTRPDLITHGGILVATGTTYGAVGTVMTVAGAVAGSVAGVIGQGGERGSPYNPMYTRGNAQGQTPVYELGGAGRAYTATSGQTTAVVQLSRTVADLKSTVSQLSSMQPGALVKQGVSQVGGVRPLMNHGEMQDFRREVYGENAI